MLMKCDNVIWLFQVLLQCVPIKDNGMLDGLVQVDRTLNEMKLLECRLI